MSVKSILGVGREGGDSCYMGAAYMISRLLLPLPTGHLGEASWAVIRMNKTLAAELPSPGGGFGAVPLKTAYESCETRLSQVCALKRERGFLSSFASFQTCPTSCPPDLLFSQILVL